MIELVTHLDGLFDALGAAVMLAFGVWVLTLRPRTRSTAMLAVFAIVAGIVWVPRNLFAWAGWELFAVRLPIESVALTVGAVALLGLAHDLLRSDRRRDRRLWRSVIGATGGFLLAPLIFAAAVGFPSFEAPGLGPWGLWVAVAARVAFDLFFYAFLALLFVLARRYRHPVPGHGGRARTQAVLMSSALVLWPAFQAGVSGGTLVDPARTLGYFDLRNILYFAGFVALAGLWLINAYAVRDRGAEGRNLALLTLAVLMTGMIDRVVLRPFYVEDGMLWGVVRLLTVVGLGYAILRHEILGVEAKFQWGVSKTTLAGIFIAVFFVAGELAETFFGDVFGPYVGIIAAGLLVFAISPLQRLADTIAVRAVPGSARAGTGVEEQYLAAVEMAWADGEITTGEERHLAQKADALCLSHARAQELQERVREERGGGAA